MSKDSKPMRCIHCGSEDTTVNGNLLECPECGEYDLTKEWGFFHYGQGGFEGFSHYTLRELSEMMCEEGDLESWHGIFVEPFHLGTGAIEVRPDKADLKRLREAVKWMRGVLSKEEPEFAESCPHCEGNIEYHIGEDKDWRICTSCGATFPLTH